MKLGEQFTQIDAAFASLMASIEDIYQDQSPASGIIHNTRIRRDLPLNRSLSSVPCILPQYPDLNSTTAQVNKLHLLRLAAFEATYATNKTPISPDSYPIILDTGASISVTPYKTDFVSQITPVQSLEIQGIASGLQVKGSGSVHYSFYNDAGVLQTIKLKHCRYVPQCTARLLCPRQLGIQSGHSTDGFNSTTEKGTLTFHGQPTTVHYDTLTQLPILYTAPGCTSFHRFCANQSYLKPTPGSTLHPTSQPQYMYCNLTAAQQKKLHLHERCAHTGWDQLNSWIRQGLLPCVPALAREPDPVCAACQFGKAHKKSHLADVGSITNTHLAPGDGCSTDGMEAGTPGRIFSTSGSPSPRRYKYVTFWVDHYSRYVHITMHETKKAEELLGSKNDFEDFASRHGVRIKNIRADNGVYTAKTIQASCLKNQQNLSFCAERFIGTIVEWARTILLHAMSKWPDTITEDFWPFALRYMVMFHNSTLCCDKSASPYELFTGQKPTWSLADFRVFGCPSYVLHKRLQDGDHFGKWQARSWRGIYVGPSAQHASNIPLIYNPQSTHVTTQFHVVFDEGFTSLTHLPTSDHDTLMEKLFQNASWMHPEYSDSSSNFYNFDSFWEPPIGPTPAPLTRRKRKHPFAATAPSNPNHTSASADFTCNSISNGVTQNDNTVSVSAAMTSINTDSMISSAKEPVSGAEGDPVSGCEGDKAPPNIILPAVSAPLPKQKVQYSIYKGSIPSQQFMAEHDLACNVYTVHPDHVPPTPDIPYSPDSLPTAPHVFSTYINLPVIYTEASISAYLALDNKEDVLTQSHMLKAADMDKFLASQVPKIRGLEAMNVFEYKPMHTLPTRAHLLSSIWSYRRKRKPNGELLKYKARICVDGSQQAYGRDYWDTYAPVVTWSTVRLVLLLSTILNLKSRQVAYTQAFPQADLVDPVYMRFPQGWHITPQGT